MIREFSAEPHMIDPFVLMLEVPLSGNRSRNS